MPQCLKPLPEISEKTAEECWQLTRDAATSLLGTGEGEGWWKEAQMHKKKLSQSWLQKSELWRAYKLLLSWDWSVRGDEVDRWHPLPYLVLWINLLIFCCCCRTRYPEEGAQVQQNLFHSCLAVQERWIGKGQESKRNWGHMTYNTSKYGAC